MKKPQPDGLTDNCLFPLLWWFIILPVLQIGPLIIVVKWFNFGSWSLWVVGILVLGGIYAAMGIYWAFDSWIGGEMSTRLRNLRRR